MTTHVPFSVSRDKQASLIDQVADGLRFSVISGHYQPGARLPNLSQMADSLGVSEIVTRRAVQRLAKEGLLNPRRGTGIEVRGAHLKTWRGHVLFIHWSGAGMYYHSVRTGCVIERLHAANVLISTVPVAGADQGNDFAKVRAELGHAVSLAVIEGPAAGLASLFAERKIPFLQIDEAGRHSPHAVRRIEMRTETVGPALRDHCLACGVRSVVQVLQHQAVSLDLAPLISAADVTVDTLRVAPLPGLNSPESVERAALLAIERWLDGQPKLPDLFWFGDDFVARGALLALTTRGIRVPADVQVISWANKGLGPVYLKPLTRVEMDPQAHGTVVAQCILEQLAGRAGGAAAVTLAPAFIVGETTRVVRPG